MNNFRFLPVLLSLTLLFAALPVSGATKAARKSTAGSTSATPDQAALIKVFPELP